MKSSTTPKSTARQASSAKHTPPASARVPVQAERSAQSYMLSGEYQKAINTYHEEHRKQPKDLPLMKEYAKSLNGIKLAAYNALEKGDPASAGRLYNVLENNFPNFKTLKTCSALTVLLLPNSSPAAGSLFPNKIRVYIKEISKSYHAEQGLFAIDPNNKDLREAVRTATQLQKNLQINN
jgi:hypothetical protein